MCMQEALEELTAGSTGTLTEIERAVARSPAEEAWALWENVGAQGLDNWYPLPSWCIAADSSGAFDRTERNYSHSSLLKSYLAAVEDDAVENEYSLWLRGMFERLGGAGPRR